MATFDAQVDKEMVTLTGHVHRDSWERFFDVALPQLTEPGFREEDFRRVKDQVRNALVQDLREANEEELGKEELQANLFAGTPYGHPVLGTVATSPEMFGLTEADLRARFAPYVERFLS